MNQVLMFIPFLKSLIADNDPAEIARIEKILSDNKIAYRVQTVSSRGTVGRYYDSSSFKQANVGFQRVGYKIDVNYIVYVRKKDHRRAQQLIN